MKRFRNVFSYLGKIYTQMRHTFFYIVLLLVVLGCTPPPPPPPPPEPEPPKNLIEVPELEEIPELSAEDQEEDREWIEDYEQRKEKLKDLATQDTKQKEIVVEQKEKVTASKVALKKEVDQILKNRAQKKAEEIFEKQIAGKVKKDSKISEEEIKTLIAKASKGELEVDELKQILIKKLGISEEEVEELIEEAKSKGVDVKKVLLEKVLEETTTLSKEEVKQVVQQVQEVATETKELLTKIGNATTAKEIRKILEDAGDISEETITAIVEKTEEVLEEEKSFLRDTMAKLYARLQRDRRLNVEEAFCANIEGLLDHLLIEPTFFETDKYDIDTYVNAMNRNYQLMEPILNEYPDIMLQLEGNADLRGTNDYNKALAERRWRTPSRVLITLYTVQADIPVTGVSRGEECQLERLEGESEEAWWTRNRRTDYMFKLR